MSLRKDFLSFNFNLINAIRSLSFCLSQLRKTYETRVSMICSIVVINRHFCCYSNEIHAIYVFLIFLVFRRLCVKCRSCQISKQVRLPISANQIRSSLEANTRTTNNTTEIIYMTYSMENIWAHRRFCHVNVNVHELEWYFEWHELIKLCHTRLYALAATLHKCALISDACYCWIHCMCTVHCSSEKNNNFFFLRHFSERVLRVYKNRMYTAGTFHSFRAHTFFTHTIHILLIAFVIMAFSSLGLKFSFCSLHERNNNNKKKRIVWMLCRALHIEHILFFFLLPMCIYGLFLCTFGFSSFEHHKNVVFRRFEWLHFCS